LESNIILLKYEWDEKINVNVFWIV